MRKNLLISFAMLIVSLPTIAGGLLTNTNQNAAFLRNPARGAVIAIDGVYSNPAGIAFLPEGFHLSLSWQAAWQKRQITSTFDSYLLNGGVSTKEFEGKAQAPVIPSFQAAYVFNDKWSLSAQFAIGGGGGKCEFDNGLPMFEKLVYKTLAGAAAQNSASLKSYSMNQQLTGEQYFYAFQFGGTYKLAEKVSIFGGLRAVLANCSYVGAITDIKGTLHIPTMGLEVPANGEDLKLDCAQSGFGITPILGLDVNLGKLNLAAKYEFRTKIELENESANTPNVDEMMPDYANGAKVRSDIPALLTIGAQYSITPAVRVMTGYHQYFDKDAKGSATAVSDNTWEANFGAEWDINDKWLVSAGFQTTNYGFEDADMVDTSFNINSNAVLVGGAYKFNEDMKLNFGYMHSFYGDHFVEAKKTNYTRKNDVVGVSFDIRF